jgi:deoxyribodipyrimidine photo-lyase
VRRSPAPVPAQRVRALNAVGTRPEGDYVLYWMIAYRRVTSNFALQRAVEVAAEFGRPLVILEALRCGYRWANDRIHRFVIEGMADNARVLADTPVTYLAYLEPKADAGRGLLEALARRACLVITDDYPCFFLPRMTAAAARRLDVRLEAVDSNGLLPVHAAQRTFLTAHSFRAHMQRELRSQLEAWPAAVDFGPLAPRPILGPEVTARWPMTSLEELDSPETVIASLPIDHGVAPVSMRGGAIAAHAALGRFVTHALSRYAEDQNQPEVDGTSRLSPYLHFGHISSHDVFSAVMTAEKWTSRKLGAPAGGKREGWWGLGRGAAAYMDQVVTWREVGFNMCATRPDDYDAYGSLPAWARATLDRHEPDARTHVYTRGEFEHAATHDRVWNAAQRQLVRDGWMHNYLRMLWGKKILEWTPAPEDALETMIEVMNKYALDGRDPNSYSGYCWTLGRYDRPWAPERPVFGTIRYMSSDNTVRKLRMKKYLEEYG